MTFSFLFIIKNSHFIKSHILSSLNFENIEIVYSNAVSPLFYYTLHFKKKTTKHFLYECLEFLLYPPLYAWIFLHMYWPKFLSSVYHFSFTSFSQETCKTFFWKIFCYQWNIFHDFMLWFPSPFHSNDYFNS